MSLSVVLITQDEEDNLPRTLASVMPLVRDGRGEIIVVDSGSTDRTLEIARSYGAKVFVEPWKGFAAQKNSAIDKASCDWVLQLDADEAVEPELAAELESALKHSSEVDGFWIPRKNFFLGRWIKHGGFYPDPKLRLIRRGAGRFQEYGAHPTIQVSGPTGRLKHALIHNAYPTLRGYIDHMNSYSSMGAQVAAAKGHRSFNLLNIVVRPLLTFKYNYFIRLGFLDGREGLLLHLYHAVYVSWKYAKAWELGRKENPETRTPSSVWARATRQFGGPSASVGRTTAHAPTQPELAGLFRAPLLSNLDGVFMADTKPSKPQVAESPISDVFEGRRPSEREKHWAEKTLAPTLEKSPERPIGAPTGVNLDENGHARFTTISGVPIRRLYTQADLPQDWSYDQHLGYPGQPPYTRGIHATGYRGKLFTMRQFSGFASPEETNQRYKYLLEHGGGGLSVAFDLPTLMGYDSDHPASEGEVGKCGVAIDSLEDMEILFGGIDLEKTTVSMTINSPASVLWAMYLVVAEKQGADWKKISGTIQNDILKEYIAQKEYIYPPAPSMRLVVDTFEFGSKFTPRFNTISISGYHIREAGSTALQELAFTLYDGVEYVEWARQRGLDVDEFGPRLSFFFNAHNDFFEEIAKYRAARKIWHQVTKERFKARNQRTWLLRFHSQTAGVSLTAQQPMNNIARAAIQAMAAVLGGTQSLHIDGYDEALALPTEQAARIALRTQQIIAYESGVTQTVDPLGGSYFLENLTLQMEQGAFDYFGKLDAMGGMVKAIERGYPQKEIAEASYQFQRASEAKEKITVGVNEFAIEEESPNILYIDESVAHHQAAKLKTLRSRRSSEEVRRRLEALKKAAAQEPTAGANGNVSSANTMPFIVDAVRAYATVGEICDALREVYGTYTEASIT